MIDEQGGEVTACGGQEGQRRGTTAEGALASAHVGGGGALTRLSKASSARVDRARRATALLAVAQGRSFARAARPAGLRSGGAVAALIGRFNQRGLAAVGIAA